jgi:hypothetical protein
VARRSGRAEWLVVGWSGVRGAVSLAAALALPQDFLRRTLIPDARDERFSAYGCRSKERMSGSRAEWFHEQAG